MFDRRSGKDHSVIEDRRKGGTFLHKGTGNRRVRQQRNIDRREMGSHDAEGRRSGIDQRHFSYAGIIPERRSGKDRRSSLQKPAY